MNKYALPLIEEQFEIDKKLQAFIKENEYMSYILYNFFLSLKDPEVAVGISNLLIIKDTLLSTKSKEEFLKILMNYDQAKQSQLSFFKLVFKTNYSFKFLFHMNIFKSKDYKEFSFVIEKCLKDKDLRPLNMVNYLNKKDLI